MKIEMFTPTAGRVILKKTRELTKTVEVEKPDYDNAIVANPEKQGEHDLETPPPVVPTIKVKEKATQGIQIGEVVAINPNDTVSHGLEVGDKVAYGYHTLKEFDLVKGKYGLLDIYNVLGKVTE
jgi:co-chaperonin GroES (HSP10)